MAWKKKKKKELQTIRTSSANAATSPTTSSASGGSETIGELQCLCLSRLQRLKRRLVCCSNAEIPPCPLHIKRTRKLDTRTLKVVKANPNNASPLEDTDCRDVTSLASQDSFKIPDKTEPKDLLTAIIQELPENTLAMNTITEPTKDINVSHGGRSPASTQYKATDQINSLPDDDENTGMTTENAKDTHSTTNHIVSTESAYKLQDDTEITLMHIEDSKNRLGDEGSVPLLKETDIQQEDPGLEDSIYSIFYDYDSFSEDTAIVKSIIAAITEIHSPQVSADTEMLKTIRNNKGEAYLTDETEILNNVTATRQDLPDDTEVNRIMETISGAEKEQSYSELLEVIEYAPTADSGVTNNLTHEFKSSDLNQSIVVDKNPTNDTELSETMTVAREGANNLPVKISETRLHGSLNLAQESNVEVLILPSPKDKGDICQTDDMELISMIPAPSGYLLDDEKGAGLTKITAYDTNNEPCNWEVLENATYEPTSETSNGYNLANVTEEFDLNKPTVEECGKNAADAEELLKTRNNTNETTHSLPCGGQETNITEAKILAQNDDVVQMVNVANTEETVKLLGRSKTKNQIKTTVEEFRTPPSDKKLDDIVMTNEGTSYLSDERRKDSIINMSSESINTITDGNIAQSEIIFCPIEGGDGIPDKSVVWQMTSKAKESKDQLLGDGIVYSSDINRKDSDRFLSDSKETDASKTTADSIKKLSNKDRVINSSDASTDNSSNLKDHKEVLGTLYAAKENAMNMSDYREHGYKSCRYENICEDEVVDSRNNDTTCDYDQTTKVTQSRDRKKEFFDVVLPTAYRIKAINDDCDKKGLSPKKRRKRIKKIMKEFDQTVIRKTIQELTQIMELSVERIFSNDMTTEQTLGQELDRDDVRFRTKKKTERKNIKLYEKENNIEKNVDATTFKQSEEPGANDSEEVRRGQEMQISGKFAAVAGARPKTTTVSDGKKFKLGQKSYMQTELLSMISQGIRNVSCRADPVEEGHQTTNGVSETARDDKSSEKLFMDPGADKQKQTCNDADAQGNPGTKDSHNYKMIRRRKKNAKW